MLWKKKKKRELALQRTKGRHCAFLKFVSSSQKAAWFAQQATRFAHQKEIRIKGN